MSQDTNEWGPSHEAALEYGWGQYREWAATARKAKADLTRWRSIILALTITGAILGTVGYQLQQESGESDGWTMTGGTIGVLAGITVGLATYFSRELLSPDRERSWVRSRTIAEGVKKQTYLFRAQVAPYDETGAPERLLAEVRAIEALGKDLQRTIIDAAMRKERLPTGPLTVDAYFAERVDEQINKFYIPRARQHAATLQRGRTFTLVLGAISVILGVISFWGWTAGWVVFIATLVAAIGSYLHAGRYQYLIISYQATAAGLQDVKTSWKVLGSAATKQQGSDLVQEAERIISVENQEWMAKLLERQNVATDSRPTPTVGTK